MQTDYIKLIDVLASVPNVNNRMVLRWGIYSGMLFYNVDTACYVVNDKYVRKPTNDRR